MCHLKRIAVLGWLASAITLCSGLKPQALAITRIRRFCVICLYAPRHPNLLRSLSAQAAQGGDDDVRQGGGQGGGQAAQGDDDVQQLSNDVASKS